MSIGIIQTQRISRQIFISSGYVTNESEPPKLRQNASVGEAGNGNCFPLYIFSRHTAKSIDGISRSWCGAGRDLWIDLLEVPGFQW